jgi:hypothetical protein
MIDFLTLLQVFDSSLRLATPLLLVCLAGLFSERAGIFDIGLEGKLLAAAFVSAAFAVDNGICLVRSFGGYFSVDYVIATSWISVDHTSRRPDHIGSCHKLFGGRTYRGDSSRLVWARRPNTTSKVWWSVRTNKLPGCYFIERNK